MIVNTKKANEHQTGTTLQSSSLPLPERVPFSEILNNKPKFAKDCNEEVIIENRYSIGLAKIQMRLAISLMFVVLPGVTQVPSLARGAVPAVATTTNAPNIAPATSSYLSSLDSDELLSRRRSMDAARLTLEDYSGKKRPKIPGTLKKQMDMQDRRLSLCQELSTDAFDWEQCFYYGTDNGFGGGAMYFDGFAETNLSSKTVANPGKPKVPTW